MRNRIVFTFFALLPGLIVSAGLAAEDLERAFRAARPGILQQLKDRQAETRVAAVHKLREFPIVEAANVILLQGCTSPHAEVRRESLQTLTALSAEAAVRGHLQAELARDVKRGGQDARSAAIAGALLSSPDAAVQASAKPWLDAAQQEKAGPAVLVGLVDELAAAGDEASLRALVQLGELPLFQKQFGPRRAWIQALIQIRLPAAVTLLIERLPALHGETRADILRYLTSLRGQRLEGDEPWRAWWAEQKAAFRFPAAGQPAALAAKQGEASYYGLPLYGTKIVFIIDTSGSMTGARLAAAQRELVSAIAALPDGVEFNVVAFNSTVTVWQSQLVPTSAASKDLAARFVLAQVAREQTASFDALDAAFMFDAEAIYFLTDGAPTTGKIKQPEQIVAALSGPNRVRRITVNCLGIGVNPRGPFDRFLEALATQNFGQYRRVDQ